jgi:hypothetical protein
MPGGPLQALVIRRKEYLVNPRPAALPGIPMADGPLHDITDRRPYDGLLGMCIEWMLQCRRGDFRHRQFI